MPKLWGQAYTRAEVLRRLGDMRQLAAVQPFELSAGRERGSRCLNVRNAAGLEFTVMADRGLGLYDLRFHGVPLPFITAAGVVHPAYAEHTGLGWLRTWPGGLETPCGLTQVGNPCQDNGEELGLHGRLAQLSAHNLQWQAEWQQEDYVLSVEGSLREAAVFGHNLVLTRRIWTKIDEPRFWIEDRIENQGTQAAPLMFLHHFNLGFPLLDAATKLELPPRVTEARDDVARPGLDRCCEFSEPIDGYEEQVFYHDLQADASGTVEVRLVNPAFNAQQGLGVVWRYPKAAFPILVQWKMMRAGLYVAGVEPANCHVLGRCAERERGTLQMLEPQTSRTFQIEVAFFNTAQAGRGS